MAINKMREQYYTNFGGINEKSSVYTTGLQQFLNLRNYDGFVPNALTKRPGSTQAVFSGISGRLDSIGDYRKLDGSSYLVAGGPNGVFTYDLGSTMIATAITGASVAKFDYTTLNDWFWGSNGETMFKYSGESLLPVGLPAGWTTLSGTGAGQSSGFFKVTGYAWGYLNVLGHLGPVDPPFNVEINVNGGASEITLSGFTTPAGYGITAIALYRSDRESISDNAPYNFLAYLPTSTETYVDTFGNTSLLGNPEPFQASYSIVGSSVIARFIEVGENRAFFAGLSAIPSTFAWSEIGTFEDILPENFSEARSDDGDEITALKFFQGEMTIFKRRSFFRFIGDSNDNFELKTVSTEYGCISNKAIVEYENLLAFLDEKGVVVYNGSDWRVLSDAVEDTFRRVNLDAAKDCAVAVHYPFRNQIWFGIPVDGSTFNNLTAVYDYLLGSWYFHDGFSPASFEQIKSSLGTPTAWYGDYSGIPHYFSPSFYADNGTGFTNVIETRFMAPDGANVTNMFRQFFLDVNTQSGVTGVVDVEVFTDYDRSTVKATFSVFMDQFQTRTDFGVGGKSIAFKMYFNNISLPAQINGWTVRRRYLRSV